MEEGCSRRSAWRVGNSEGCGGVNIRHLFCRVNFVEGNSKSRGCIVMNALHFVVVTTSWVMVTYRSFQSTGPLKPRLLIYK